VKGPFFTNNYHLPPAGGLALHPSGRMNLLQANVLHSVKLHVGEEMLRFRLAKIEEQLLPEGTWSEQVAYSVVTANEKTECSFFLLSWKSTREVQLCLDSASL